ncbi:MAG: VWA domain-containing protein [Candidatus Atribacteria bacterium]|nr:VWA domain-containing protein [Candidatus Atribacteria bacterium]
MGYEIGGIEEAELLILAMDCSGTMEIRDVYGGQRRADVLKELADGLVDRLSKSNVALRYRVAPVYFCDSVESEPYMELREVKIKHPLDEAFPEKEVLKERLTCIACALEKAEGILNEFNEGEGLPEEKCATMFLFTDGQENVRTPDEVKNIARKFKAHATGPSVATIALGTKKEIDPQLLWDISSGSTAQQRRHLDNADVLKYVKDSNSRVEESEEDMRLFLWAREEHGSITKELSEAMRQFVIVLSQSSARGEG